MLINLSNHPFEKWSLPQQESALETFGKREGEEFKLTVEEIPFPNIPPDAEWHSVAIMAKEYRKKIQEFGTPKDLTVHLMGEITFVCVLHRLLKNEGYKVVCSTTERKVVEMPDGKKIVQFDFVRFRGY